MKPPSRTPRYFRGPGKSACRCIATWRKTLNCSNSNVWNSWKSSCTAISAKRPVSRDQSEVEVPGRRQPGGFLSTLVIRGSKGSVRARRKTDEYENSRDGCCCRYFVSCRSCLGASRIRSGVRREEAGSPGGQGQQGGIDQSARVDSHRCPGSGRKDDRVDGRSRKSEHPAAPRIHEDHGRGGDGSGCGRLPIQGRLQSCQWPRHHSARWQEALPGLIERHGRAL